MLTELISQEAHLAARHLSALLRYIERIFLIGRWILEQFQVPAGTIYLTGEILRAA